MTPALGLRSVHLKEEKKKTKSDKNAMGYCICSLLAYSCLVLSRFLVQRGPGIRIHLIFGRFFLGRGLTNPCVQDTNKWHPLHSPVSRVDRLHDTRIHIYAVCVVQSRPLNCENWNKQGQ